MQNKAAMVEAHIDIEDTNSDRHIYGEVVRPVGVNEASRGCAVMPIDETDLKGELGALLSYIEQAKSEIAALRPKEYSANKIPEASNDLDAIVQGTEVAATKIMDSADEISDLAQSCNLELSGKLVKISTELFEASGFQDITGQRVNKVVTTLAHLEAKLSTLADAVGDTDVDETSEDKNYHAKDYSAVPDGELLNGPQLDNQAQDQAAIDALFDEF